MQVTLDAGDGSRVTTESIRAELNDANPRFTLAEWRRVAADVEAAILEHRPDQITTKEN
ncbi:hypothetical protein SEA_FOSTEROUS_47 [Gordonia phage Fosterous]|uniref:Uncharacterized protein n=2 Tax=Vividuovirus TaxID=2560251 RepID=A0A142K9V1_9CAUD|nr:hypothetical protein BJD57_gp52 [Gordonia phage Vivi2]YP_010099290.1 hypothetical protein KNU19_gp47 [Gordonia phage Fosterous]AMS02884.1 hypothetical protein SEA_VIVI2_52 [Gordonia phage Vivi2]AYR02768.1 hypothetical protein SEA_FOSTEROUS_47 [Gordonia phage Fosterous]